MQKHDATNSGRGRIVRRLAAPLLLGASLAAPGLAWAQQGFVGLGVGSSSLVDENDAMPGANVDDSDTGWKVFGGYSFNELLAVEVGYVDFGEFSAATGSWEATGINVSALGTWPLGSEFSLLGKVGANRWDAERRLGATSGDDTGTDILYGVGLQYDFTDQIGGRFEWERFANVGEPGVTGESDLDLLSVSVAYKF
ncbi:MAG TPA: outer membrane beta-barrel protein [Burkholderiales bacterium]